MGQFGLVRIVGCERATLQVSAENWRSIALEKMRNVKPEDGAWATAPNHSRPVDCVVEADIDAEDQPQRAPQNGH